MKLTEQQKLERVRRAAMLASISLDAQEISDNWQEHWGRFIDYHTMPKNLFRSWALGQTDSIRSKRAYDIRNEIVDVLKDEYESSWEYQRMRDEQNN